VELNPLRPAGPAHPHLARPDAARPDAVRAAGNQPDDHAVPPPPVSAPAAETTISAEARQLARLDAAIDAAPEVREALVAQLRTAILTDQYQLDPEAIARGIASLEDLTAR